MTEDRDEGYIKFLFDWNERALDFSTKEARQRIDSLINYRQSFYDKDLIGVYPDGIGFGNISLRIDETDEFLISGSKTGEYQQACENHFCLVKSCLPDKNLISCEGPVIASSESMTHHMFYQLDKNIKVVVHVHHKKLWDKFKGEMPTTGADIPYGTPEMAYEIQRLYHETSLKELKVLVMAGHDEGLIAFGDNFASVEKIYESLLEKI